MMHQIAGNHGTVRIGDVVIPITAWNIAMPTPDEHRRADTAYEAWRRHGGLLVTIPLHDQGDAAEEIDS